MDDVQCALLYVFLFHSPRSLTLSLYLLYVVFLSTVGALMNKTENVAITLPNYSHQEWQMMFQMYDDNKMVRAWNKSIDAHVL